MPPIKSTLPDVPSSTLNPYNEIAFDDIMARSYAGNVIAMALPREPSQADLFGDDEVYDSEVDPGSASATVNNSANDGDILTHTMAAILYVEAKQAMEDSNCDSVELDFANDEDKELYREQLDDLLDEFSDRFDENDHSPSKMPPVDIKIKEEYKDFFFLSA